MCLLRGENRKVGLTPHQVPTQLCCLQLAGSSVAASADIPMFCFTQYLHGRPLSLKKTRVQAREGLFGVSKTKPMSNRAEENTRSASNVDTIIFSQTHKSKSLLPSKKLLNPPVKEELPLISIPKTALKRSGAKTALIHKDQCAVLSRRTADSPKGKHITLHHSSQACLSSFPELYQLFWKHKFKVCYLSPA